ncbi:hypothetical protein [Flagellimonas sp. C4]|uniref:hypothetical protein n=1 Tax=Flagellimonas alginolytica TaxID=3177515 RepID=UPI0035C889F0
MNIFKGKEPRNPNEFVEKFIRDVTKERAQLEMIYKNRIILQVDSLKWVPSWFKLCDKNEKDYADGYVVFFVEDEKDHQANERHHLTKSDQDNGVLKMDEMHGEDPVVTIAKFLQSTKDHTVLAVEMRNFIDRFYSFEEENPNIMFNIRYLKGVEG